MPKIVKQNNAPSRGTPKPVAPEGGLLSRAVAVNKVTKAPLKILMYGKNRVGKTTLACQFPKPLLLISCEPSTNGGIESIRNVEGVTCLLRNQHLKSTDDLVTLSQELERSNYKTVVIDSATSLQDWHLCEILNLPKIPDQLAWGMVSSDQYRQRSEKTRESLRPYIDLGINTIILAKERDHNPPKEERVSASGKVQPDMRPKFLRGIQSESFIASDLGGATVEWLQDSCDCVCRLFVEEEVEETEVEVLGNVQKVQQATGKYVRYLRTAYHPNFAAGVRSPNPDSVPEVIVKPTYQKIYNVLTGKK